MAVEIIKFSTTSCLTKKCYECLIKTKSLNDAERHIGRGMGNKKNCKCLTAC